MLSATDESIDIDQGGEPIATSYRRRTPGSARAFAEAERYLPGGNSRQAGYWAPYPLTLTHGQGCFVWDVDGNRYIDLLNNYTALVHGHAHPRIVEAVQAQVPRGTCWAAINAAQTQLARLLVERVASVEQVRFTNSGTEAANLALMVARLQTGRQKILMARGGYHGSVMEFEAGFTGNGGPLTHIAEYGDLEDFRRVLAGHGAEIAAVFLEPVLGASGVVPGTRDFLQGVKQAAHEAGALFVLDEVLTFRLALGGRQQSVQVEPDLTLFGKLIGGGFPVGAVGGCRETLGIFDPAELKAFHTGTFNANPITMLAGSVSVEELTAERIAEMECLAERLKRDLQEAADRAGLPLSVNHVGSIMNLFFSSNTGDAQHARDDQQIIARFHLAALNHGLFIAPRGLIALSTVLTDSVIDEAVECASSAMMDVAKEIL